MADLGPGSVVAGCRLEQEIGRGGMGVVYRAIEESLERTVALKLIAPELTTNPDFRERFKRESRLAASIEHPNVIPVYAAGETEELLYLVMRYIPGTDLRALIEQEGALEPSRAARMVAQVASALAAAHRRGLIHRDVKPANVLIEKQGASEHAYLTDFGIARDVGGTALTRTGMLVGTLDYIAPERLEDRAGNGRSDVYALGCVLFEALTGRVPFPRDSDVAKMYAHMNEPVPSVGEVRPEVPPALSETVSRAMAKRPDDRFASADDFADTLRSEATTLSGVRPVIPRDATALSPTQAAPPQTPPPQTGPPQAPPPQAPPPQTPPPAAAPPPRPPPPPPPRAAPARPTATQPASPPSTPTERPPTRRRRGGVIAAVGGAVVVAGVIAVVVLAGGGSDSEKTKKSSTQQPEPQSISNSKALSPIDVGSGVDGIEAGAGSVWATNRDRGTLMRIAPSSRRVTGTTKVGANPDSVAVNGGSVWVTNTDDDTVSRVSASSGKVEDTLEVGDAPEGIVAGDDAVWVANSGAGTVTRLDTGGGAPHTAPAGSEPIQLAFDDASDPWVTLSGAGAIQRLNAKTGQRAGAAVQVGGSPRGIASAAGLLWVSISDRNQIAVVNPSERRVVKRITVPDNPREVRAGEGGIWVTCADAGSVAAIDTSKRAVATEIKVQGEPFGVAAGEGEVWAGSIDAGMITPIKPG
jgi:YVTN family beta-propeller protein